MPIVLASILALSLESVTGKKESAFWLIVGFSGQMLFFSRFIVQWLYSEYHKEVRIPLAFWYLSIAGSLVLLTYAVYRRDPVFMLAYSFNLLPYIRNLMLMKPKEARAFEVIPNEADGGPRALSGADEDDSK